MKAILEFNYPDDEDRLRHALYGSRAISGLDEVRRMIRQWEKHDGENPQGMLDLVRDTVLVALKDCMED